MKKCYSVASRVFITAAFVLLCLLIREPADAATLTESGFILPEYSKTISLDFMDAPLNDVLKIFSQQSGLNFIADQGILDRRINVFLEKVPVEEALEKILSANNLAYELQPGSNIFVVKTAAPAVSPMATRVYLLKFATVSSSKINKTMTIKTVADGGESDSGGDSGGAGGGAGLPGQGGEDDNAGLIAAVKNSLTGEGNVVEDPRTNSLIITDRESQFPIIEITLARLDVPVPQILIEAELLDISKEAADQIGVKMGTTPLTFTGAERDHVYPWNQNQLLDKGLVTDPAYRVGTISAKGLSATLQFLKTLTDTKNLARPRILTLNNETAEIKISTSEAIGLASNTSATQSVATVTSQAERVETGVFLTVTPQANIADGEITLAIAPKVIQARTGGTFEGKTFKDPEERGSKSILRISDGETIIIGGLLRTDYSNVITKLPVLGDLPVVGMAFRHKNKTDVERELVIFITPHIVKEGKQQLAMSRSGPILREQDLPPSKLKEVDRELSQVERERR